MIHTLNTFLLHSYQVEDQKARLLMLLGSKDVQLTLMTEMLAQNAYTVSTTRGSGLVKAID